MSTPTLLPEYTSHCFFARICKHTVVAFTPQAAHDEMEAHYRAKHFEEINRIVGWCR